MRELYEAVSTNPRSMEAGEYELTRGMCFVERSLKVVAVAELLCISWCVLGAAGFRFFSPFFFFECTRPAANTSPPRLISSLLVERPVHRRVHNRASARRRRGLLNYGLVDIHSRLVDVQSPRTGIRSIFRYRIHAMCGEITSLFLLVMRYRKNCKLVWRGPSLAEPFGRLFASHRPSFASTGAFRGNRKYFSSFPPV